MLSFSAFHTEVITQCSLYTKSYKVWAQRNFLKIHMIGEIGPIFQDHVSKLWLRVFWLPESVNMCGKELHLDFFFKSSVNC